MPYRTELKRPDLKGQFPCSVCGKIFCHSSSLSRHRMQAHFKSYTCTQCNQEISTSETLRSHMFRYHQISRMFMCRCCNWAFPDKTSLHIHMQSMIRNGKPGDVAVLARSSIEGDAIPEVDHHHMLMMEAEDSASSSPCPDEFRDSTSPMSDELKMSSSSPSMTPSMVTPSINHSSFNSAIDTGNLVANSFLNNDAMKVLAAQTPLAGIFPQPVGNTNNNNHNNHNDLMKKLKSRVSSSTGSLNYTAEPPKIDQGLMDPAQWIMTFLTNNPQFPSQDQPSNKMMNDKAILLAAAMAAAQAENVMSPHSTPRFNNNNNQQPAKKPRVSRKSKSPGTKHFNFKGLPQLTSDVKDMKLNISIHSANGDEARAESSSGKLNSVIDNILSVRAGSANDSYHNDSFTGSDCSRRNKRKARVPQQLTPQLVVDGVEVKTELGVGDSSSLPKKSDTGEQKIKLEEASQTVFEQPEQPSPAVSDSQTSGSSHLEMAASPKKCVNCELVKGKLEYSESRVKELLTKIDELTEELNSTPNINQPDKVEQEEVNHQLQEQIDELKSKLVGIEEFALEFVGKVQEEAGVEREVWVSCLKEIAIKASLSHPTVKSEPKFQLEEEEDE